MDKDLPEHKKLSNRKEKIQSMLDELVNTIDEQIKENHDRSLGCWNRYENEIDLHKKVDAWQEYQFFTGKVNGLWNAKRLITKRKNGINYEFDW